MTPPLSPDLESAGSVAGAILAAGWLFLAAWSAGRIFLSATRATAHRDDALLATVLGLNVIGWVGMAAGPGRWLAGSRSLLLLAVISLPGVLMIGRGLCCGGRSVWSSLLTRWRARPRGTVAALLALLFTLGPALSYPSGWDELVYHIVLPRRWLADGRPAFYPDLPYSGFPSLGETLFWLAARVECLIAPRLISWGCWMLGLGLTYRLIRRALPGGSGVALLLTFALCPALLLISANCYVETLLLMNFAGMLVVLWPSSGSSGEAATSRADASPWVVGLLVGGAAAVKLTGMMMMATPLVCAALRVRDAASLRQAMRFVVASLLMAAVVASPFYLRTWLETGNPFYPYFATWIGGDPVRVEMSEYRHTITGRFGGKSPALFVLSPWLLAFEDALYDGTFGWQSWLLLGLAAWAIWRAAQERRLRAVSGGIVLAVIFYTAWFATSQQARFAISAALPVLLLATDALARMSAFPRRLAVAALAAATVCSLPWQTAGYYLGSWETLAGRWSRRVILDDGTDYRYVPVVTAVGEATPAAAKLLLLFEHRGLYFPRANVVGTPYFQETGPLVEGPPEPQALHARLKAAGFTHLVMATSPIGPDVIPDFETRYAPTLQLIQDALALELLQIVWTSESHILLEVRE